MAGTEALLGAAADCPDVESVVVASSSAVYDRRAALPLSESAKVLPLTPYGISEAAPGAGREQVARAIRFGCGYFRPVAFDLVRVGS